MIQDPTVGLRNAMAAVDLYPGDIVWDGAFHRFPGAGKKDSNTSGWYKAFPDRKGGVFGDHSNGLKVNWQADRSSEPTKSMQAEWAEEDARRKKERAAASEKAIAEATVVWDNAVTEPTQVLGHPYLKGKEIESCDRLRISSETELDGWTLPAGILLIPMLVDRKLVNLQRITRDGQKRYWPKAPASGASLIIGGKYFREETTKTIYVAEGWATAWTISEATKSPCMVAFSKDGLLPVAKKVREKFHPCPIVIAADNDRWTVVQQKEGLPDIPNPGVHYARLAAEELGCEVAIPDFHDLSKKPTDFDDVRLQEGMGAVTFWIEPDNAGRATILPDQPGDEPVDDREPLWVTEAPFRCLGFNEKVFYFLPANGQLLDLNGLTMSRNGLKMLAPKSFWRTHFDSKRGVRWGDAIDAVITYTGLTKGVFMPNAVRGRGMWRTEEGALVAHFGDRLLAPGDRKSQPPESYNDGSTIYYRQPRIAGPSSTRLMPLEERRNLLDMIQSRHWKHDGSGFLLMGWVVLAPFCGALDWRPHVWVNGSKGCGKTKIIELFVLPLLADMVLSGQGRTTEAGIRQALKHDALPVICDEMEGTTRGSQAAVRQVLELARSASAPTGRIIKGSQHGRALTYSSRSMFLLASISVGLTEAADKSRFCILPLMGSAELEPDFRRQDWSDFRREQREHCHKIAGRQLMAAQMDFWRSGKMFKLMDVCKAAADQVFKDARMGDQYGTLAAGAWTMMSDDVPSENEVIDHLRSLTFAGTAVEDEENEGFEILTILLQVRENVRIDGQVHTMTVGELIDLAADDDPSSTSPVKAKHADNALRQIGIRIAPNKRGIMIANTSEWVKKQLAGTSFHAGWGRNLRGIRGAERTDPVPFSHRLQKSRATFIPFDALSSDN